MDTLKNKLPDALLLRAIEASLRSGRALYYKGDTADRCWYLQSGTIRLLKPRADGASATIGELHAPGWLGLAETWLGLTYAVDALAMGECSLLKLGRASLFEACKNSSVSRIVIDALSRSLYDALDLFDAASATEKVARAVASLAPPGEGTLRVETTQAQIAEVAGVTRETVNKCLARLERGGLLETARSLILVYDRRALIAYEE